MERTEIERLLGDVPHTIHGGSYAVVDMTEEGALDAVALIDIGHIASSRDRGRDMTCISLDCPYEDEEDISNTLHYCGLYAGQ